MAISNSDIGDLLKRLEGFSVAILTPLQEDGDLDVPALERIIDRVLTAGARGVFPLGWMGEGPLLTDRLQSRVVQETVRIVNGRALVISGVTDQSLPRVLERADMIKKAGADIILSTPPYSYHIGPGEIHEYFKSLAEKSNMPVIVYHNNELTVRPDFPVMLRLSETPGVIGVKASCDFNLFQRYFFRAGKPGRFAVFSSSMYHIAVVLFLGVRHLMLGTPGNLTPSMCGRLFRQAEAGEWEAVAKDYRRMVALYNTLAIETSGGDVGVKLALSELGFCKPYVTPPLKQLPPEEQAVVRKAMKEFRDIVN